MEHDYTEARKLMVREQLVARHITNPRVLAAMEKVPRHLFVAEDLRYRAYEDGPLPIGKSQTISQPYIVALMVQALELKGGDRVLEIGTGSGYEAAILAQLDVELFSIERLEELALKARTILDNLGYRNISILVGDGTLGWQEHAPYDAVVISAAAPQIPRPLIEQLKPDGILVLPIGEEDFQTLVRIRKGDNGITEEYLGDCRFVKLKGTHGWEE
jgi:protein-L-isoaspartate(D-aspartate) O-methyltransferase